MLLRRCHSLLFLLLLIAAGRTPAEAQRGRVITEGMTWQEVVRTFGPYSEFKMQGDIWYMYYRNRCVSRCPMDVVVFRNGYVASATFASRRRRLQSTVAPASTAAAAKPADRTAAAHAGEQSTHTVTGVRAHPASSSATQNPPEAQPSPEPSKSTGGSSTPAAATAERNLAESEGSTGAAKNRQAPRRLSLSTSVSGVFDSNLYRNSEPVQSWGTVTAARVHLRSSTTHPGLQLTYEAALHSFSQTDEWDRISHNVRASLGRQLSRSLSVEALGEASLKGTSEDRDLGDQYLLSPRLEYRISRANRLRLAGAYRVKQLATSSAPDEFNRYAEIQFRQRLEEQRWEVGFRIEDNDAENPRREYLRWTYSTAYTTALTPRDELMVEIKYRSQKYDGRLLEIKNTEVARHDHRWLPSIAWTHNLRWGFAAILEYRYEMRSSNDPDRNYNGQMVAVTAKHVW